MNNPNIKIVLRRLIKEKTITLVNIIGLSLGIACAILLTSWILYETSYDKYISEGEKIYRVTLEGYINNEFISSTQTIAGIGPMAMQDFPEVENYTRLVNNYRDCIISLEDKENFRVSGFAADSTFFDIFPYKSIQGNLSTALSHKDQIVIDQYLSEICFGDKDPLGEIISVDNHKYTVSAVMENIPSNSHLKFHFLVPFINEEGLAQNQWGGDNAILFLKLKNTNNIKALENEITKKVYDRTTLWERLKIVFRLQPLYDIYLSNYSFDYSAETGSKKHILIFSITAFLVLLIAGINFTNLFIASTLKRKRAIGIKLTIGAHKKHVLNELFLESLSLLIFSFLLAILLVKLVQPYFIALSGKDIIIKVFSFRFLILSLPILIISLVLINIFPWLHLKQLSPLTILKKGESATKNKFSIQKALIVLQFVIAIVLICNVTVINKQLHYLNRKQLGFNKENIIYTHTNHNLQEKSIQNRMRDELSQNTNILGMAFRSSLPTIWTEGNPLSGSPEFTDPVATEEIFIDEEYFDLMQISFIEGENIFSQKIQDNRYCIINKMTADKLGLKSPYTDKIIYEGPNEQLIIKGVINNVNTKSLAQVIDPCIYRGTEHKGKAGVILIKITDNYKDAINAIQNFCQEINPDIPFEYHFLDNVYENLYATESNSRTIMLLFTIITIAIILLGLLAMVLFITESRIKEIGIRKINGANISEIIFLLIKDFVKWVILAFLVASPIAYFTMHKWLENFAYRTTLSWWIFLFSGGIALFFAVLAIAWQSWRTAIRNPVDALRYE